MEGDSTPDAQKNDLKNEDPLMNVNNDVKPSSEYGLPKSRNMFRQKDAHWTSVLSSGKWLKIVKNSPKVSCEVSTSPGHFLSQVEESWIRSNQSKKTHKKVISLSRKMLLSPSKDISQGTLKFGMRAKESPRFVFKLENSKDVYVASLSSNVKDQSVLDYSYMIHLQKGESSSHLVGRIKVSTLLNDRKFVLFSSINSEQPQKLPCRKKNRGLSKKVVDMVKNNGSISRLSIHELCSWDHKQVNLLANKLPTNLETLAVVVKQEFLAEEIGGWGLKFLKKSSLVHSETSRALTSMNVVIPEGIHGGPEDGPLTLIERWKSQGTCECGGWDLGCSLTLLKGQPRKDHCNLFTEGSQHETPELRIVNVRGGLYFVQFRTKISVLQSLSIVLAFLYIATSKSYDH